MSLTPPVDGRLGVAKTYKLYVGGAFPRSESGRSYPVTDTKGRLLAHAALASRKDVRDAVSAARAALPGWSGATAYNRGQVLYRVAEMLQARREGFVDDVVAAEGISRKKAGAAVDAAVDRWVWYAGWTDKIATVLGSVNPVAGPYVNFSTPVPTGVVGVLAPAASALHRAGRRAGPGARHRLHRRGGRVGGAAAARRRAGRGARDVRRARRCGQPAHRPRRRAGAVAGRARRRRRAGPRRGARGHRRRPGARGGRYREARAARRVPPASWPGCAPGRS